MAITTHICAPTEESAQARAEASGIPAGEWRRVGPDPADLDGARGGLLFAEDWRAVFPAIDPTVLGVTQGAEVTAFITAAHRNPDLVVEIP